MRILRLSVVTRELRDAVLRLRRRPVSTAIIVGMLALAIGANGVIFSVVNAVLLRPLPFASPERLVVVGERTIGPRASAAPLVSSYTFTEWRDRNRSLESVASVVWWDSNIESGDTPRRVALAVVSEDYFRVIGVQPMLGRSFLPEEISPAAPVLVVSYEIWQSLGGGPDIIGHKIRLNGGTWTIIGVMPKLDYAGPFIGLGDIWIVQATNLAAIRERKSPWRGQQLVARLRNGATIEQARGDLAAIRADLAREHPEVYRAYETVVEPLQEFTSGNVARPLAVLAAAVALILLIACANVANLLLAQATARRRELALRAALGASPGRLARESLAESAVLALSGGGAGLLLAMAATQIFDSGLFASVPQLALAHVDGGVIAFTLAAALCTTVLCGVVPALTASRRDAAEMLRDGGRTSGDGRRADVMRRGLLAFQIALSLTVLAAAGLMTRTFHNLMGVDAGFRGGDALVFDVMLPSPRYPVTKQRAVFFRDLTQRLSAIPGVVAVGANRYFPLRERQYVSTVFTDDRSASEGGVSAQYGGVTEGYFSAMGIRLTDGRFFTSTEMWDTSGTAIVGERLAKQLWPGRLAVGQRVKISATAPWLTVIGVVADVRQRVLDEAPPPQIYVPYSDFQHVTMTFVVRTKGAAAPFAPAIIQAVRALDPVLPAFNILTLDELLARSQAGRRVAARLLAAFAGLGLVLALFGVASVMSFVVARSRRELGVRLALGARPADIVRMVVGQGLRTAGAGIAAGIVFALGTTHVLRGLLFDVSPFDPMSLGGAAISLAVVTVLACLVPARRAASVDPLTTLRSES